MSKIPKVTRVDSQNPAPSDEIIKNNNTPITISDGKGRQIILKRPNVLAQYRLIETLGESAKNEVYVGMVLPLLFVHSIDSIPINISKKSELEALIQQLDNEGIEAVSNGVQEYFASASADEVKEKIKK